MSIYSKLAGGILKSSIRPRFSFIGYTNIAIYRKNKDSNFRLKLQNLKEYAINRAINLIYNYTGIN